MFPLPRILWGLHLGLLEDVLNSSSSLYVVVSSTAVTRGGFKLRGYASATGRLDVIARCIMVSQLDPSSGFIAILLGPPSPPRIVVVKQGCCRGVYSERWFMLELSRVLSRGTTDIMEVIDVDVERLIHVIGRSGFKHVILKEDGVNAFRKPELVRGRIAFYLGSHVDMPGWIEETLLKQGALKVSLGPLSVHSEHAILAVLFLRGLSA